MCAQNILLPGKLFSNNAFNLINPRHFCARQLTKKMSIIPKLDFPVYNPNVIKVDWKSPSSMLIK